MTKKRILLPSGSIRMKQGKNVHNTLTTDQITLHSIAVKVLSTMLAKITDSSLKIYSIFYVQIEWVYYLDKLGGR